MASHNELGKKGEELAAAWLIEKGFKILHKNWKSGNNEIDIIATDDEDILHFVEVKIRRGFEYPERNVNRKKFSVICRVADAFLYYHPRYKKIQFDIVAINLIDEKPEYFFIRDVYL